VFLLAVAIIDQGPDILLSGRDVLRAGREPAPNQWSGSERRLAMVGPDGLDGSLWTVDVSGGGAVVYVLDPPAGPPM
jgi:hypothetical protein